MNFDQMVQIENKVFHKVREIRTTKGKEYAGDEDTLADFKEIAAEVGITPLQVWAVYVKKHQRAIDSYIEKGRALSEGIDSRILDVIVYHQLLLGLIEDLQKEDEALAKSALVYPARDEGHSSLSPEHFS